MSEHTPITGELREAVEWEPTFCGPDRAMVSQPEFDRICDAIDAVHAGLERENAELHERLAVLDESDDSMHDGWVRLPVDADGVPIHVGDTVTCARSVWEVTGLRLTGLAWGVCCTIFNDHGGSGTNVYPPCDLRHYYAPTVEDVLREFAYGLGVPVADSYIAASATKLRLAGDAE